VDIGANVGQFAIPLAIDGHMVYSFEPVEATCNILKRKVSEDIKLVTRLKITCVGVDEKDETKSFGYVGKEVPSASYKIIDPNLPDAHVMSTVRTGPVQNFMSQEALDSVHVFKTDTQGYEGAVLRGSHDLLHRPNHPRFLLVEYSHYLLTTAGTDPREILKMIYSAGYVCTHLRYHHPVGTTRTFGYVDSPPMMRQGGVTATFDETVRSIGPDHGLWSIGNQALETSLQNRPGWTDLLCFG